MLHGFDTCGFWRGEDGVVLCEESLYQYEEQNKKKLKNTRDGR